MGRQIIGKLPTVKWQNKGILIKKDFFKEIWAHKSHTKRLNMLSQPRHNPSSSTRDSNESSTNTESNTSMESSTNANSSTIANSNSNSNSNSSANRESNFNPNNFGAPIFNTNSHTSNNHQQVRFQGNNNATEEHYGPRGIDNSPSWLQDNSNSASDNSMPDSK